MKRKTLVSGREFAFAALFFLLSFGLYVRTLVPNLLTADAAEFQTLSYTLGMTHPSGYAVYVFLGKAFTLLPIKNIAYRVNLMSAFFGAWTVGAVYLILRRLGGGDFAASVGALALTVNPLFWRRTIFAETYAPAAGMIASVFLLVLLWDESKKPHFLFWAGLLGGISLGIHSTVVMTAAAVLVYLLFKARSRADWLFAAAGAFLGALIFLGAFFYLDWHNPPSGIYQTSYLTNLSNRGLSMADFATPWSRFFVIFPARHFWVYYFSASPSVIGARLREYVEFYPFWALGLMLLGSVTLFWRRRIAAALYLWLAFLLVWGFAVTVAFDVYREFYAPAAVMVHIWLGLGAEAVLRGVARSNARNPLAARYVPTLLGVAFVAAVLFSAKENLTLAIRSAYTVFIREEDTYPYFNPERYVRLAEKNMRKIEDNAIVFDIWDRLYTQVYTAHVLEGRTGISFHEIFPHLGETTLAYIDENIDHRPIYFANLHPEIALYYDLEQVGDQLYRLHRKKE
jgi:hypothetical protein